MVVPRARQEIGHAPPLGPTRASSWDASSRRRMSSSRASGPARSRSGVLGLTPLLRLEPSPGHRPCVRIRADGAVSRPGRLRHVGRVDVRLRGDERELPTDRPSCRSGRWPTGSPGWSACCSDDGAPPRERTGQGQVVDLSIYEPLFWVLGAELSAYDQLGTVPVRMGSAQDFNVPRGCYRTADGSWIALSGATRRAARRSWRRSVARTWRSSLGSRRSRAGWRTLESSTMRSGPGRRHTIDPRHLQLFARADATAVTRV